MEVQIYLAKFLPDPRRGEPRNVGLVVRTAMDDVLSRFILEGEHTQEIPKQLDIREYAAEIGKWKEGLEKYGVKALLWVGKRKNPRQRYYLEFAGGEMIAEFNFDRLYEELVL